MSRENANSLCQTAYDLMRAAQAQAWGLAFPTACDTLMVAANCLSGAAIEIASDPVWGYHEALLGELARETGQKGAEILAIAAIPWPFVYAAIGAWAGGLANIQSRIPSYPASSRVAESSSLRSGVPNLGPSASSFHRVPLAPAMASLHHQTASIPSTVTHVGKGPKGYRRSDERIREDVCDRFTQDPSIDASLIEVAVSGGKVVLEGTVENRQAKRRAEDLALAVTGVVDVETRLGTPVPP